MPGGIRTSFCAVKGRWLPLRIQNEMAGATGLEPAASCVTGRRSNQLNYAPALKNQFPAVTACALLCPRVTKTSQKCRDSTHFARN